ncbi:MAG TPA: hypothetical protein DHW64_03105 [Chitinophagaceae bacterium]|jgi:hypothetical protein|nr:hypothetical protein [Chitinophagaceae bacterium]
MSSFIKTIASNWHFMRVLRVVLSLAILVQSWYAKDGTTAVIGFMLLAMGLLNIGCCGPSGCYTPLKNKKPVSSNEPVYEEVV